MGGALEDWFVSPDGQEGRG